MKRGSAFARWMKRHPATPRLVHAEMTEREALKPSCPTAQRMGQDQYRCHVCGIVWGVDEPRPPCQSTLAKPRTDGA